MGGPPSSGDSVILGKEAMNAPRRRKAVGLRLVQAVGLLLLLAAGCTHRPISTLPGASVPRVRVLLLDKQQNITLLASDQTAVRQSTDSAPKPLNLPSQTPVPVERTPDGWRVGEARFGPGELWLLPASPGALRVNGRAYRGQYRLVPTTEGRFDVVNDVDVDGYLMGVLSKELLWNWHDEAYRAQAITARTYALYEARTSPVSPHFDLYPDERSQVYGGIDAETAKSRAAAAATAGIVVAYGPAGQERIFKAYFSACCGGIGQSAADAFGDAPTPPLMDRNVGVRCNASPRFTWAAISIPKDEASRRIRTWAEARGRAERNITRIEAIDIGAVNPSGRPVRFVLTDDRGVRFNLRGEDLRYALNSGAPAGAKLYSSFFKPVSEANDIRFIDGHGFGHGVGLCQWCAEQQAGVGTPHETIVLTAFPGARLVRAY